jgi:hypothetical protein
MPLEDGWRTGVFGPGVMPIKNKKSLDFSRLFAGSPKGNPSTSPLRLRLRGDAPAARLAAHGPPPAADRREQPPGLPALGPTCAPSVISIPLGT